jgi:hypothetical protein
LSALDTSSSIIFFTVIFIMGFITSIVGLFELATAIEKKRASFLAIMCNLLATSIWFPFTLVWFSSSDLTMYFGFGYLWLAFGFIFTVLSLLSVFLWFRYSIKPEDKPALEIREIRA